MDASLRKVLAKRLENVDEIEVLEQIFSGEELFAMVEQASVRDGVTAKLRKVMKGGVDKPSELWKWSTGKTVRSEEQLAIAIGWWSRCEKILVQAAKQRRMEISAPSCEDDALAMSKTGVSKGRLEEVQVEIPASLKQKLQEVVEEHKEFTPVQDAIKPEEITAAIILAVIDSLGVRKTVGFKARESNSTADVVIKQKGKTDYDFNESVLGGVIELKSWERGPRLHGAALVQAMKYLHSSRKNNGRVGSVWARVYENGLEIHYRMGIADWDTKSIVATETRHLIFNKGNFSEPEDWKVFLGFIMQMDSVTLYATEGDPELPDSEEKSE